MSVIENDDGFVFDGKSGVGGKVIRYNGDILIGIPTRESIVRKCNTAQVSEQIERDIRVGTSVMFMPNDVTESTYYDNRQSKYCLRIFGILKDGLKAEVVLTDIDVFFDVRVPDSVDTKSKLIDFELRLRNSIEESEHGLADSTRFVDIEAFPIRGYNEQPIPYKRIYTNTTFQRKNAIKAVQEKGWETASDDQSSYYRKVAREYKLQLSDWVVISDYKNTPDRTRSPRCTYTLRCAVRNYKPLVNPTDDKKQRDSSYSLRMGDPLLSRDRTMVMAWDIETHSHNEQRERPEPTREGDTCFMISMTVHWKDSVEPLTQICIVSTETAPDPNWVTVICDSQVNLLRAFALCWGALSPDIQIGFCDSLYDWPFVVELANKLNILEWMFGEMTAAPKSSYPKLMEYEYNHMKPIKITVDETATCSFLKIPGCVPIDVQICFKKLIPKSEFTRLDYYLTISGLANKTDMPILRMWKYYIQSVTEGINSSVETKEHMRQVAHYCVVDSISCQRLLVRRNVINDYREVSRLAYVSMSDSHYYAGGMRVCNLLGAYAFERNYLMSMRSSEVVESGKYPGAYVFQPEKGLFPDPVRLSEIERRISELKLPDITEEDKVEVRAKLDEALEAFDRDRPVTGLDFSSLYPSLIMTYNLSLEKMVLTLDKAKYWESRGKVIHPIEFIYNGRAVYGWSIRHEGKEADIGLFPSVLIELFAKRAEMKTILGRLSESKELMDVIYGKVKSSQIPLSDAINDVELEAKLKFGESSLALADGAEPPQVSPGGTIEEEISNLKRTYKKAKDILEGISHLRSLSSSVSNFESAIATEYDRVCFEWGCINSKQNALKIYMNTFYGETGTARSPLYLLQLAGGVTSAGRYNIKYVASIVRNKGYRIKYGDTDSLYVVPPRKYFLECDEEYIAGRLTREEWMGTMVRITMRTIAQLRDEVNQVLKIDSGAIYLKMAFEEVLYPGLMCGMKRYFGIPHVNEVNFYPRDLFARGIEVLKQGQPGLSKDIGYRIMWDCMKTNNMRTVENIVFDVLKDAINNPSQWKFSHFVKSDTWRPHKDNKSVQNFMKRMRIRHEIEVAENTKVVEEGRIPKPYLYNLPEPGERFKYIIVTSNSIFDIRGRKSLPKKGDRMELIEVANALSLDIDIPYYMASHVVGLCARFINGDAQFMPPGTHTDKAIDELSYKSAKKHIENYIKLLTGTDTTLLKQRGLAYRRAYKKANILVQSALEKKLGSLAKDIVNRRWLAPVTDGEDVEAQDDVSTICDHAKRRAVELITAEGDEWFKSIAFRLGITSDGTDIDSKTGSTNNLYKIGGNKNRHNLLYAHQYGLATLDRLEMITRSKLAHLTRKINEIHERYELNLEHIVHELRIVEDSTVPNVNNQGVESKTVPDAPPIEVSSTDPALTELKSPSVSSVSLYNITENDRQTIIDIQGEWYTMVSIYVNRHRYAKYNTYIQELKDKRLGVVSRHLL